MADVIRYNLVNDSFVTDAASWAAATWTEDAGEWGSYASSTGSSQQAKVALDVPTEVVPLLKYGVKVTVTVVYSGEPRVGIIYDDAYSPAATWSPLPASSEVTEATVQLTLNHYSWTLTKVKFSAYSLAGTSKIYAACVVVEDEVHAETRWFNGDTADADGTTYGWVTGSGPLGASVQTIGEAPEPDPPADGVTGADVAAFLGRQDAAIVALADAHLPIVSEFVNAYVRGHGVTTAEDGELVFPRPLRAVITSATARLVVNPAQLTQEVVDGYAATGRLDGFTLAELAVLNRYRRLAC